MRKLWPLLDGHVGLRFRQRELVGPYLVDFLCPAARLVICLIGEDDDGTDQVAWLHSQGYRVLSFDAAAVAHNPEAVLDAVADAFTLRVIPGKS
jgi:very-short-patch-repair endonuclease